MFHRTSRDPKGDWGMNDDKVCGECKFLALYLWRGPLDFRCVQDGIYTLLVYPETPACDRFKPCDLGEFGEVRLDVYAKDKRGREGQVTILRDICKKTIDN